MYWKTMQATEVHKPFVQQGPIEGVPTSKSILPQTLLQHFAVLRYKNAALDFPLDLCSCSVALAAAASSTAEKKMHPASASPSVSPSMTKMQHTSPLQYPAQP